MSGTTAKSKRSASAPGRKPAYQNSFAFKHNPASKKTARIAQIGHRGLCKRCHEQIEWRKKYRKYKALKRPRKCNGCSAMSIKRAYHTLCDSCAGGRGVCAKCGKEPQRREGLSEKESEAEEAKLGKAVEGMREREKRAVLRRIAAGDEVRIEGGELLLVPRGEDDEAALQAEAEAATEETPAAGAGL